MQLILFNKPYGVLTAFRPRHGHLSLADFLSAPHCHPAGRLDADSEGLLLLTDSGPLQARLTHPRHGVAKRYYAQVEGEPRADAVARLANGVELRDGRTLPAAIRLVERPDWVWPRTPPVRFRKHIPTAWLEIELREGRNRQVRRMTAAVGHPTLRLIRWGVGPLSIVGLAPGDARPASASEMAAVERMLAARRAARSKPGKIIKNRP